MENAELEALIASVAQTPEDAAARFEATREADPYPEIPPALLNTADLLSYVSATGMVYPLVVDPEDPSKTLKPASCAIRVRGPYLMWRGSGRDRHPDTPEKGHLEVGAELVLERNSIVYVTLEPTFRLPDYIAGRFNLTIRDVYRGMLVGTGPLVDPGFQGRLSLPLHNLTANDYVIEGGEPLVWMEFTKLSPHQRWLGKVPDAPPRTEAFVRFPSRKLDRRSVRHYVRFAHDGPIRSSIPELVAETAGAAARAATEAETAAHAAQEAQGESARIRQRFFEVSVAAGVAIVIALVALLIQGAAYVNDARNDVDAAKRQNIKQKGRLDQQGQDIRSLKREVARSSTRRGTRP